MPPVESADRGSDTAKRTLWPGPLANRGQVARQSVPATTAYRKSLWVVVAGFRPGNMVCLSGRSDPDSRTRTRDEIQYRKRRITSVIPPIPRRHSSHLTDSLAAHIDFEIPRDAWQNAADILGIARQWDLHIIELSL